MKGGARAKPLSRTAGGWLAGRARRVRVVAAGQTTAPHPNPLPRRGLCILIAFCTKTDSSRTKN